MKKLSTLLLSLIMLFSLAACGGEKPSSSIDEKTQLPEESAATDAVDPTTAPDDTAAPEQEPEPEKPSVPMTTLEQPLFQISYPEADGWEYDEEEDLECSETYGRFNCEILDEDEWTACSMSLRVEEDDADSFRHTLQIRNVDLKAAFLDQSWPTREIGGLPFIVAEGLTDTSTYYLYHDEASGMSLSVYIDDRQDTGKQEAMLDGITFSLPDNGLTDPPLPWDGTPYELKGEHSVPVGSFTLTSTAIPFSEPNWTYDTFTHDIEVVGDKAYLLSMDHFFEYTFDGSALTLVREIPDGLGYRRIDTAPDGTLFLSRFATPLSVFKDGSRLWNYDGSDTVAIAPDGTWGVSYFLAGKDCEKVTIADGTATMSELPLTGINNIISVHVTPNHILAAGSPDEGGHSLFVLDHSGKQQMVLTADKVMGAIVYATETPNGFMAIDGNMRKLFFWDKSGTYIGYADDGDLFGTDYPWMCAATPLSDGSFLVIMTHDREDESASELLAYRVSGF